MLGTHREATIGRELRALDARYELIAEIGHDDEVVVYLARDQRSGRRVTLRTLAVPWRDDAEAVRRFTREARAAAALQHPNIVRTLSVEVLPGGVPVIVGAHAPGRTLRQALCAEGALGVKRAERILRDVGAALAHAHAHGMVHRGLEADAVYLVGARQRALVGGFEVARHADGRADVHALGRLGWEMLVGSPPRAGQTLRVLRPEVPPPLRTAIERALDREPAARWPTVAEMLEQLAAEPHRPTPMHAMRAVHAMRGTPPPERRVLSLHTEPAPRPEPAQPTLSPRLAEARRTMRRRRRAVVAGGAAGMGILLALAVSRWAPSVDGGETPAAAAPERPAEVVAPPTARVAGGDVDRLGTGDDACLSATLEEQRRCLEAQVARGDAAMQAVYASLVERLRGQGEGGAEPPAVQQLHEEQQAWLAARDQACRSVPDADSGATGWAARRLPCYAERARGREAELRRRLAALP